MMLSYVGMKGEEVRFGLSTDIQRHRRHVCFTTESGH
jgi:hypothetical protein